MTHEHDHDGMARHHHDDQTGEAVWWLNAEQFGGERIEHQKADGDVLVVARRFDYVVETDEGKPLADWRTVETPRPEGEAT